MDYFLSQVGVLVVASLAITGVALIWYALLERNAELKRQRAQARKKAEEDKKNNPQ